ncbi:TRIM56 [Mytilus coruscus]|uniref:TRIM56 n=1 Tax=Mytilus coruscus TaxID=42192 RepID=A0A6J8CMN1_MYTCO|nr:TRIM56 [Mytilus coruscus]
MAECYSEYENYTLQDACRDHQTEDVRFYCEDCKVFICDDCIIGDRKHSKCSKTKLKTYGDKQLHALREKTITVKDAKLPKIKTALKLAKDVQQCYNESQGEVDLTSDSVAAYHSQLTEIIQYNCSSEIVPKFEPLNFAISERYSTTKYYRRLFGHFENYRLDGHQDKGMLDVGSEKTDRNGNLVDISSCIQSTDEDEKASDFDENSTATDNNSKFNHVIVKRVLCEKDISYIIPKGNQFHAWLIGKDICEINLSTSEPILTQLISSVEEQPVTAARSKAHYLLVGLKNKGSLKKLQVNNGTINRRRKFYKLVTHSKIKPKYMITICTPTLSSNADIIACMVFCPKPESSEITTENHTIIRWTSSEKITKEICIPYFKVAIANPVSIAESSSGDICITCSPEQKSSWVVLLDKNGSPKMRYPSNESKQEAVSHSFIGAAFLSDGNITVMDRVRFRQHLINNRGELLNIIRHKQKPCSFAVDYFDNIWIGFDDRTVQVIKYDVSLYEDNQLLTKL